MEFQTDAAPFVALPTSPQKIRGGVQATSLILAICLRSPADLFVGFIQGDAECNLFGDAVEYAVEEAGFGAPLLALRRVDLPQPFARLGVFGVEFDHSLIMRPRTPG